MASVNTTVHNYLTKSIAFNNTETLVLPQIADIDLEFAKISPLPSTIDFSGRFSIHVWAKFSATAIIRSRILQTSNTDENNVGTRLMLGLWGDETFYGTDNNALRIGFQIGITTQQLTREPVLLPDTWHHIVLTPTHTISLGGGQALQVPSAIYIDGCSVELVDAFPVPVFTEVDNDTEGGGTQPEGLVVGWSPNIDGPLKGNIASLAIFNKVLTDDEIETLAQGTINLASASLNLKSSIVSWWKMGDGDDFTIANPILLDSVGTNHLTTVNMDSDNSVNDVPKERPRKHQNLHLTTGADRLPLDPNGPSSPFIWDSFSNMDDHSGDSKTPPPGWYSRGTPTFSRVSEAGKLSILKITNTTGAAPDVITNVHSTQAGNTFTFGPSNSPDATEYCLETSIRIPDGNNPGSVQIGFFNAHGTYGGYTIGFNNSVFFTISDNVGFADDDLSLHITGPGPGDGNKSFVTENIVERDKFHHFKLCCGYYADDNGDTNLKVTLEHNGILALNSFSILGNGSYPTGGADIGINVVAFATAGIEVDIEWISVTHRSIGSTDTLGF